MQTLISKIFILLTLFSYTLFGCTLCTIYSPETKVSIKINADDKKIKNVNITWVLTKEFTNQLKQIYDMNQNNHLDKDELEPIEQSILDYVKPKNFLVHISYDKVVNKELSKKIDVKEYKTFVKNSRLHFDYDITLNYDVIKENALYIKVDDEEKFFILLLAKNGVKFNAPFEYQQIVDRQSAIFQMDANAKNENLENANRIEKEVFAQKEKIEQSKISITEIEQETLKEETLLESFSKKVKDYLVKIENGDDYALFILLGISFLYGIIHALGPGHGKSLAFSYFASNKSSFIKAFWVSQASAFIHIIGALILVMVSVFLLQSMLNNFVNDSVEILTKVSAAMIMILAAYILYNKLTNKPHSCAACCSVHSQDEPCSTSTSGWSTTKPANATSLKPNFMKKDLYFVLTAGLIPCPGTVVLFIYAFILKTYFAVILASIFISLGMGLVIFASSFLGVSVHKLSERSHKLTNALEILAPIVMFILGILLFLNADIL